ncbi:helix-turn-helix transcriptional regulator [Paraburkholderia antibiotica]|uniref:AAA family ATPase n=1 Tax=Paraburkholderia antibiotica TaxID=2728839 RepID=A0A7X9X6L3_9BURK|nr:LuxR family transcriptional regulator [Paraburkholderia antibiotica]NML32298.1 AAA family ATPase [Paraburkholderia antibiotica]
MAESQFAGPFLERQRELEQLLHGLREVCGGAGRFVAVSGEAGIGKSRLADEFCMLSAAHARMLSGRAYSATSTTPYAVWIDALDAHLRALSRRDLLNVIGESHDLLRLFPAVAGDLPIPAAPPRSGDIDMEQTRIVGQMRFLLARLSQLQPIVLVLDNLQWADRTSIELLHHVVRDLREQRVLLLGLFRRDALTRGAQLSGCIESLERLGLAARIELGSLGVEATGALIEAATHHAWPADLVARLHAKSQGNPFFIGEFVKHELAQNRTGVAHRYPQIDALPASIGEFISERFRGLVEDSRRTLAVAAVIETKIAYPLLRAVTGFSEERLLTALDELLDLRLLDEHVDDGGIYYEFHQPLVQTTVYESLGAARRQFLHRIIAKELMDSAAPAEQASRIARHLLRGTAEGRQEDALPYLLQAANDAVACFANNEAVALLNSALRILERSKPGAVSRTELELLLGESYKRLGDFLHAVDTWRSALGHTLDARQRATLRRCIGRALWQAGAEAEGMRELQAGMDELGEAAHSVEGAFLRQEFAQARLRQGDIPGALQQAAMVLEQIDEHEAPELVSRVYIIQCLAYGLRGDGRRASQAGNRAIGLAETIAYPGAAFLAHYTMAALLRYDGEQRQFDAHTAACTRIAERMQSPALATWPLSLSIERQTMFGRLADAVSIGERAVDIDRAIDQGTMLPRSLAFLAVAVRLSGDPERAAQYLDEARRLVGLLHKTELRTVVVVKGAQAYLAFLNGQFDAALEQAKALLATIATPEPLKFYLLHPHVLPLAAEAAVRSGEDEQASDYVAAIRALQGGGFHPALAAARYVDGLLSMRRRDDAQALVELREACAMFERDNRVFDAARVRVDLARAYGQGDERDAAVTELLGAGERFAAIGALREAAAAARELRRFGLRPTFGVPRRASGQSVSAREKEVIAHIAKGLSNKEIAARLALSELTIETHVKNILRKLGLRSRTQVAAYAMQEASAAKAL